MIIGKLCAVLGLLMLIAIISGVLVLLAWHADNGNRNNQNEQGK